MTLRPMRLLRSRPRLWLAVAFGVAVFLLSPPWMGPSAGTRALVAWNAFAALYLLLALQMVRGAQPHHIHGRAVHEDEGRLFVLALVLVSSVAVVVAIGSQLATVKNLSGTQKTMHVMLAAVTLLSSWLITQLLFALHYAHDFYLARARGRNAGLNFPDTPEPGYGDFFYFACILGTSAQTADVSITSPAMRRVSLLHCIQAYFFNTTVLALTINIAAGLF